MAITEQEKQQIEKANASGKTPVVFIHGLWLLPSSWDNWVGLFEEAGYAAVTPVWPDDPLTVEEARANPDVFAKKSLEQIADHTAEVIGALDKKPAVMGHSTGGLLAQMIADRGLSAATVAIDPGPFRGVLPLPISALKSASPVLANPLNKGRAVTLTLDQFKYGWANALSEEEAKQLYETYHVAAPGVALMQMANANLNPFTEAKLDTKNPERGPAADHRRRGGPHGAVGDRQRLLQETEPQLGRHRDQENPEPRPLADDRQRLARGRGDRARVRQAVHPSKLTSVRAATPDDAGAIARLLHDFNTEYSEPTPPVEVLAERCRELLAGGEIRVLLVGEPAHGLAVLRFRPSIWSEAAPMPTSRSSTWSPRGGDTVPAERLMDAAIEAARAEGAEHFDVVTGEDDTAARGLYESLGMVNRERGPDGPLMLYYELEI